MSYTIDVYKRRTEAVRSLEDYALFVMFFPVLVAGPIERAGHMMPKLTTPAESSRSTRRTRGLFLILMGLFKKVAIADGLARAGEHRLRLDGQPTWADIVAATLLFAFQIYCDFSGLYRHRPRGRQVAGVRPAAQLQPAVLLARPERVLAALAHQPVVVAPRLPLHPAGRQPRRRAAHLPQPDDHDGAGRPLARGGLDLRPLGLLPGRRPVRLPGLLATGRQSPSRRCIRSRSPSGAGRRPLSFAASIGVFFVLTCYGWLLFRAGSLGQVVSFTGRLFIDFGNLAMTLQKPTLAAEAGLAMLILLDASSTRRVARRSTAPGPARSAAPSTRS